MEKLHATYPDKPIWLTEFNANVNRTSEEVHKQFMELAVDWMNDQDYVKRYAYFFERNHPETNANKSLTAIGLLWKSLKTTKTFAKNITADASIIKGK